MIFKSNKLIELVKNKDVIMFGAGIMAKYYVDLYSINVKYYVDNNAEKWESEYLGKRIISPEELLRYKDNSIIFICSQYIQEISNQLNNMGFNKNINYFIPRDLEEKHIVEEAGTYIDNDKLKQRILLDMSQLAWTDNAPGISRVVKNLVQVAYKNKAYNVVATQQVEAELYEPSQWLRENNIVLDPIQNWWNKITYKKDDILLLPDAIWGQYDKFQKVVADVQSAGGKVISIIHDIIPIENPDRCDRFLVHNFKSMILEVFMNNDGIIAISKTVADKIIEYITKNNIVVKDKFKIGWFHNGFDKRNFLDVKIKSDIIKTIMKKKPFIIVGTIEPRKGHETALDAFEKLWQNGFNEDLCIIGKVGWNVKNLIDRIKNHKEYNKRLFFIEYPSDEELAYCYNNAEALIFPSINEGFGLPLIEGASYKLPLILSDIDIFKELASNNALYFKCSDADSLKDTIIKYKKMKEDNVLPKSERIQINSWEDSFNEIMNVIINNNWYKEY